MELSNARRISGDTELKCELAGVKSLLNRRKAKLARVLERAKSEPEESVQTWETQKYKACYVRHISGEITILSVIRK